jgi:hypothetical protein
MYGNAIKSPRQTKVDDDFIGKIKSSGISLDSGSRRMAALGWSFLGRGDKESAMKRFNQCWLLAADNFECYWGFGAVKYHLHGPEQAIHYHAMGAAPDDKCVKFNVDISSAYVQKFLSSGRKDALSAFKADSIINAQLILVSRMPSDSNAAEFA